MVKITLTLAVLAAIILVPLRFAISSGGLFRNGIVEGIQACKQDSDCIWVPTGCCACDAGGNEMLINREKEWIHNLLVKDVCVGDQYCTEENYCQDQNVFCDRTCKFGKKTYTKPLLVK